MISHSFSCPNKVLSYDSIYKENEAQILFEILSSSFG